MKKLFSLLFTSILFATLFFTSCSKTEEPEPSTPSNSRAKFHGNWAVSENSKDFGPSTYNLTITDSSNAPHLLIAYLYGFNKKTYATVNNNNITIPAQTIQANIVSGSGVLTNTNRIDISYLVQTTGTHYDTVTAVLTK